MLRRVHIAGFPVKVGNQGRQLCAWCGAVLFEADHARELVAPNADGTPGQGSQPWEVGSLVAVDGNTSWSVPHEDGLPLSEECCAPSTLPPIVATPLEKRMN